MEIKRNTVAAIGQGPGIGHGTVLIDPLFDAPQPAASPAQRASPLRRAPETAGKRIPLGRP